MEEGKGQMMEITAGGKEEAEQAVLKGKRGGRECR